MHQVTKRMAIMAAYKDKSDAEKAEINLYNRSNTHPLDSRNESPYLYCIKCGWAKHTFRDVELHRVMYQCGCERKRHWGWE